VTSDNIDIKVKGRKEKLAKCLSTTKQTRVWGCEDKIPHTIYVSAPDFGWLASRSGCYTPREKKTSILQENE
jgi:hypothetical protein